jgi:hypothetical protein
MTAVAVCLALAFASVIVATRNAQRDEAAAERRYADAQALIALPPASRESLAQDLDVVKQQISTAQASLATPSVDAASDALTSLLVRGASDAGLSVKGISRANPGQATINSRLYDVQSLHLTLSGALGELNVFLRRMSESQPFLIPAIASASINDAGAVQADVVFSVYTTVASPTAVPAPAKTAVQR